MLPATAAAAAIAVAAAALCPRRTFRRSASVPRPRGSAEMVKVREGAGQVQAVPCSAACAVRWAAGQVAVVRPAAKGCLLRHTHSARAELHSAARQQWSCPCSVCSPKPKSAAGKGGGQAAAGSASSTGGNWAGRVAEYWRLLGSSARPCCSMLLLLLLLVLLGMAKFGGSSGRDAGGGCHHAAHSPPASLPFRCLGATMPACRATGQPG